MRRRRDGPGDDRRAAELGAAARLHVTNGESAGTTLRETALGGAVLPWRDALHDGPAPAVPRQQLLRARAGFLADCGWGGEQALLASLERRDRQLLEALRGEADRVERLGLDRWIGGTHLTAANAWRWDPAEAKLVR